MITFPGLKLEAVLAGAVSANQPEVHVDYVLYNQSSERTKPTTYRTVLASASDVTILLDPQGSAIPQQAFICEILGVSIYNKDTASVTVTVKTDDGTNERIIRKVTLLTLETLSYDINEGWYATDASGARKTALGATGQFTTLTVSGNTTLGDAAADTVTINAASVLMPNKPAFLAFLSATVLNVTGNATVYTVLCDSEVFDQNSNYNNASGTFTAPFSGRYRFTARTRLTGLSGTQTSIIIRINTSNRIHVATLTFSVALTISEITPEINCITDMDAGDTATSEIIVGGIGADTADVFGGSNGNPQTMFCGELVA